MIGLGLALALLTADSCRPWPNLDLAFLLPDSALTEEIIRLNDEHQKYLEHLYAIYHTEDIAGRIRVNLKHRHFWGLVHSYYWYAHGWMIPQVHNMRKALADVIDYIGWDNFIRMDWPLPIAIPIHNATTPGVEK